MTTDQHSKGPKEPKETREERENREYWAEARRDRTIYRAVLSWAVGGRGFGQFEQSPACINIIGGDSDRFIVRIVNVTAYDPAHLGPRHATLEETQAQYRAYQRAAP